MSDWHDNRRAAFRRVMIRLGLNTAAAIERATGVPATTIRSYLGGQSDSLSARNEHKLCGALGISIYDLYEEGEFQPTGRRVWVKGFIQPGARIAAFAQVGETEGYYAVTYPSQIRPGLTLAAMELRGGLMPPAQDGWLIYYDEAQTDPALALGQACVVETVDGDMLVRIVRRGFEPGRYSLHSWDGAPPAEDVPLKRAMPILAMIAPDAAQLG